MSSSELRTADRAGPRLSASLERNPELDTWLEIHRDGAVTVRTGKAELGQGLSTAIAHICAEELEVSVERVRVETADTARGPMEFMTVGSMSMEDSGAAVRQVCAEARHHMLELAGRALGVPRSALRVDDGEICVGELRRSSYAEVMGGRRFARRVTGEVGPKPPETYRYLGRRNRRTDLRAKLTGGAFLHDQVFPDLLHARVLRPPSYAARLAATDTESICSLPGVVRVVQDGAFLAVIARGEHQAIAALRELSNVTRWECPATLPDEARLGEFLWAQPSDAFDAVTGAPISGVPDASCEPERPRADGAEPSPDSRDEHPVGESRLAATYTKPYVMHASIGPSVAIARWSRDQLTVWSHSQGVAILRLALAASLGLDRRRIRVIHVAGAGCYGHNGADDAAHDAALLALALPERPVRVQWSREDEHTWEPYSPAARVDLAARIDPTGRIHGWRHEVGSNSHMGRPFPAGDEHSNFVADWHRAAPKRPVPARPRLEPHAGIHRNADPYYDFDERCVVKRFVHPTPLRVSSTRSLGAFANVFAIESFIDELAHAAAIDPLELRLRHLSDPRARRVLEAVAERAGWRERVLRETTRQESADTGIARGTGVAFARYKNSKTYAAVAVSLAVDLESADVRLERAVIAADAGQIIDRDGLENQLEGGFIQAASWTLVEAVRFDATRIRSRDWETYPILRFDQIPDVETLLFDHPGAEILGAGEATQGPTPAAIANAVFDATGARVRELPITPQRLRAALQRGL